MTAATSSAGAAQDSRFSSQRLRVKEANIEAEGVISIVLTHPDGAELPAWSAGAHIDIVLPSGLVRQYSLCGNPLDRHTYKIAVLRESQGRGGSEEIHTIDLLGREFDTRGPRNHFELYSAASYIFVAGGIGVTPLYTMAATASGRGIPFEFHYGGRDRAHMAFAAELVDTYGSSKVHLVPQDEFGLLDLTEILANSSTNALVYACGPEALLKATEAACEQAEPRRTLHLERFAVDPSQVVSIDPEADRQFEVELRQSGITLQVPADRTILEVVRDVVPGTPSSCEEGFCGSCETAVLEGQPDHRDQILSPEDQDAGDSMMICVSRCRGRKLVLDL